MTLILCYSYGSGIMLLGDSGLALGGGTNLPTEKPVPKKVQRSPNKAIAGALWGDLAFNFNGNSYQPDLWLEHFLKNQVSESTSLLDAKNRLKAALAVPSLTIFHSKGGGLLLAGFESGMPTAYELTCVSKSDIDHALNVRERRIADTELRAAPIVRGLSFNSWDDVCARCGCGTLNPQNHRMCIQEYLKAVRALAQQNEPVAEPVRAVYIKTNPFHRTDLNIDVPTRSSVAPNQMV